MAEPDPHADPSADSGASADAVPAPGWSQVWQVPTLLLGLLLLGLGYYLTLPGEPGPTHAQTLDAARQDVKARNYEAALQALDKLAEPEVYPELGKDQKVVYHLTRGDALRVGVQAEDAATPKNLENVVKHYQKARELGGELGTNRLTYLNETLLALGRTDEASELADQVPPEQAATRLEMRRRVLNSRATDLLARARREGTGNLAGQTEQGIEDMRAALERFMSKHADAMTRAHRIWAIDTRARLLMAAGEHQEASELLMRWLQKLDFATHEDVGGLMVLLGEAHLALDVPRDAESWLDRAMGQLGADDARRADAMLALAEIRFAEHSVIEAAEFHDNVITQFPDHPRFIEALVGLAEAKSRLNGHGEALDLYERAVRRAAGKPEQHAHRRRVIDSLRERADLRFANRDFQLALDYLEPLKELYGDDPPADYLARLGVTHERRARRMLGLKEDQPAENKHYRKLEPPQRTRVALHFEEAAKAFYQHAQNIAEGDNTGYGRSLWRAADNYDLAGDPQQAIKVFEEFIETQPDNPRRLEALFRLAQAYHATGEFDAAIELYRRLVEDHPNSQIAFDALVPLARAYLAKGSDAWDRAEQVLRSVVTDHEALRPESRAYREALIELGGLYYRRGNEGDYERAIERLNEAVQRYADQRPMPAVLFQLADAYRKSVDQLDGKLAEPLPPSERNALAAERARRLAKAKDAFNRVIRLYEAMAEDKRGELENLYLRNSYFYRADCAYELGDYEGEDGAIALYDEAVQRYEQHPAALVALIQIVNSYAEMGRYDLARTANERAKFHLQRIPDEAFDDPTLPMDREKWQRWLDWTSELALTENAEARAEAEP